MQSDLSIVVPTRNEEDNIIPLVSKLCQILSDIAFEIIFVDDSTDNTPTVIQSLNNSNVVLIHRKEDERTGGLSTAVTLGIQKATGVYVCVIDADLQHPPEKILELFHCAEKINADIIIASRYMHGGSAEGLDGFYRKGVSHICRWITRFVFFRRLLGITDPLSGFFLFRREIVDPTLLHPIGYKILLEILIRGKWHTISEIPYCFLKRNGNISKATMKQGLDFITHITGLIPVEYTRRIPWSTPGQAEQSSRF